MKQAILSSNWVGTGKVHDEYRPAIAKDYPLQRWTDTTGSYEYGSLLFLNADLEDSILSAIKSDPKYGPSAVVFSKDKEN